MNRVASVGTITYEVAEGNVFLSWRSQSALTQKPHQSKSLSLWTSLWMMDCSNWNIKNTWMRKPNMKRRKETHRKAAEWREMTAAVTAGGENESMAGIDLVNLRQWSETNCIMLSPKLGQTGRERELGRGVRVMLIEGEGVKCQLTSLIARWIPSREKCITAKEPNTQKNTEGCVKIWGCLADQHTHTHTHTHHAVNEYE